MSTPSKTRVAVIFGGRSTEHPISCLSGSAVMGALDPDEYEVVGVGITRAGGWVLLRPDATAFAIRDGRLPEISAAAGSSVLLAADPTVHRVHAVSDQDKLRALADVDVVFPVLHGTFGEDGTIQGLLEMAGVPYVGAGVFASAAGMDKEFARKLVVADGVPVGGHAVLRTGQSVAEVDLERLGLPVFVKPARAGSSIGITKVTRWEDLDVAVAAARQVDTKVLIEAAIAGREIECGVLEGEHGGPPEVSVVGERQFGSGHDFCDFSAKYVDYLPFVIPAPLDPELVRRVQEYSVRAFNAFDCTGLARVDFFVTDDGQIFFNEINTMPGFTESSMFPQIWAASGLEYPKLVSRMVRTALRRQRPVARTLDRW